MDRTGDQASFPNARAIGLLYLAYFVAAFLTAFLTRGIVVAGNVAATVSGITAHATRFRAGCAADVVANALYIALVALLYWLFEPVDRRLSMVAVCLGLAGCAIQLSASAFQLAPLLFLQDAQLPSLLGTDQLRAATLVSLTVHAQAAKTALVMFGLYDVALGYLIARSIFVPRAIGVVLMIAGAGWLTFVWAPLSGILTPVVLPLGALAEIALMLWLVVKGTDVSNLRALSFQRRN